MVAIATIMPPPDPITTILTIPWPPIQKKNETFPWPGNTSLCHVNAYKNLLEP